ncbi:MAG: hypothetical protein IPK94_00315 [Saprospiraceae bacterium]|nr:hypothetical protein [Saprospiraceae bacterium]
MSKAKTNRYNRFGGSGAKYATFINEDEVLGINQVNEAYLYRLSDRHLVKFIGHQLSIEWAGVIGDHVITAGKDRRLIFWNKDGKPFKTIDSDNGEFLSLDISQQDSLVAVGSQDGHILLYDYDGNQAGMLSGHSDAVNYVDVSNDGMKMVSRIQGPIGHHLGFEDLKGDRKAAADSLCPL